jgi:hypothetical protein
MPTARQGSKPLGLFPGQATPRLGVRSPADALIAGLIERLEENGLSRLAHAGKRVTAGYNPSYYDWQPA